MKSSRKELQKGFELVSIVEIFSKFRTTTFFTWLPICLIQDGKIMIENQQRLFNLGHGEDLAQVMWRGMNVS